MTARGTGEGPPAAPVHDPAFDDLWARLERHARARSVDAEPAHDFFHVERVIANARAIAEPEGANANVVATAALLHELFNLPKSHPDSAKAGDICAEHARELLVREDAPAELVTPVCAAIRDHAFSKGVVPDALESRVLQDADRLDALGAIGLARMWATCADMKRPFYSPSDPFCESRAPDDKAWGLDHVYKKLLLVPERLHLATSRALATERVRFIQAFVAQLRAEVDGSGGGSALPTLSKEALASIVETAPDGIVVSQAGIVLYANLAAARLLGHETAKSLVGQPMTTFLDPESLATMRRRVQQIQQGGELVPREYPATRRDGERITAEIASAVFALEGAPAGPPVVLAFARDVTERSRLRAQLAHSDRLAAMGVLAAGVAHEINNPLGFMRLATELFERELGRTASKPEPSSSEMLALVRDLREGVDRISAIVRDLRLFGRYEDEPLAAVDVRAALEAASRLVAHEIAPRARLRKEYDAIPQVLGFGPRLEQVFVNLLINAAFAFPDGGARGEIVIRAGATDETVEIEIEDDGAGIAPEVLDRIFDPFFTMKPEQRGAGLGLSICRGIVERSGGTITAVSEVSRGTTMRVVLPRALGAALASPMPPRARLPRRRLSIFVVDDEERIVDLVRSLLDGQHDVVGQTSSREALDALLAGPSFDVVLCDLFMPELTGMDLHERVARKDPALASRFVFMTGGAYTERARTILSSVTTQLMKPFSAAELLTALADAEGG